MSAGLEREQSQRDTLLLDSALRPFLNRKLHFHLRHTSLALCHGLQMWKMISLLHSLTAGVAVCENAYFEPGDVVKAQWHGSGRHFRVIHRSKHHQKQNIAVYWQNNSRLTLMLLYDCRTFSVLMKTCLKCYIKVCENCDILTWFLGGMHQMDTFFPWGNASRQVIWIPKLFFFLCSKIVLVEVHLTKLFSQWLYYIQYTVKIQ